MKASFRVLTAALCALTLIACGGDGAEKTDATKTDGAKSDAAAVTASSETSTAAKPFKVKSGIVESTMELMGPQKVTTYFDDYGLKQAIVTDIDMMGQKSQTIVITADGWSISYDPAKKEGTKTKVYTAGGSGSVPSIDALTDEMKSEYKFKEIDTRTFVGKEAQGYEMEVMGMPMKFWAYEGIPLRTEISMGTDKPMVTEVTKLELDVPVPADRFVVPADIKITQR